MNELFKNNVQLIINAAELKEVLYELINELLDERESKRHQKVDDVALTAEETAAMIGVTTTTLWRWAKVGYLVPTKVGRKSFYKKSDVERLMMDKKDFPA